MAFQDVREKRREREESQTRTSPAMNPGLALL